MRIEMCRDCQFFEYQKGYPDDTCGHLRHESPELFSPAIPVCRREKDIELDWWSNSVLAEVVGVTTFVNDAETQVFFNKPLEEYTALVRFEIEDRNGDFHTEEVLIYLDHPDMFKVGNKVRLLLNKAEIPYWDGKVREWKGEG